MPGVTGSSCAKNWLSNGFQEMEHMKKKSLILATNTGRVMVSTDWMVLGQG